ncbi:Aca2/YdiL-like domain-containing protein [Pasteurella multocida]|uniref:YdiL family protein n=1 Tax=Pasteurella multocida TaxID=747 RepID=A0AAW8VAG5_PASMD|nr:DUF1870 family protein [Pasteurella multocida]MDH7437573.1 DUF1870 family protein [Pasteurella multocida]MDH7438296.1 DUF1870 family protein [Pasteurella multocida]MDH7438639.1 DUF1870 family protein [Pasteurella multocida]MDH7440049.1 DUF1870 family protein [Pasteurella multocida]MDT3453558.1 YdiL family protein [Pasteurella multocida]
MTKEQLQQLRKALFLDVAEAAEFVGNVSPRAWQRWESGDRAIPSDVENKMIELTKVQKIALNLALENDGYSYSFYDYDSFGKKFGENKLKWRLYQSVLARVYQVLGEPVNPVSAPDNCFLYKYFEGISL